MTIEDILMSLVISIIGSLVAIYITIRLFLEKRIVDKIKEERFLDSQTSQFWNIIHEPLKATLLSLTELNQIVTQKNDVHSNKPSQNLIKNEVARKYATIFNEDIIKLIKKVKAFPQCIEVYTRINKNIGATLEGILEKIVARKTGTSDTTDTSELMKNNFINMYQMRGDLKYLYNLLDKTHKKQIKKYFRKRAKLEGRVAFLMRIVKHK